MAKKPEPPAPTRWEIYKVAKKAVWLGSVEAPDKDAAIEKGAGWRSKVRMSIARLVRQPGQ